MKFTTLALGLSILFLTGCGGSSTNNNTPEVTPPLACPDCVAERLFVETQEDPLKLGLGEERELLLKAECIDKDTQTKRIEVVTHCSKYKSSDNTIASINDSGKIHAKQIGSTIIEVNYKTVTTEVNIKVIPPYIKSLEITPNEYVVDQNEKFNINAKGIQTDGKEVSVSNVKWDVGNSSCIDITNISSNTATVTGLNACDTEITGSIINSLGNKAEGKMDVHVTIHMHS